MCYIVLAFLGTAVFGGLGAQAVPGTAAVGGQAALGNQAELENYLALLGKAVRATFSLKVFRELCRKQIKLHDLCRKSLDPIKDSLLDD